MGDVQLNGTATPVASVTRIESFSASHRLHSPCLTDAQNAAIFGKCNNPNGHGHNYKLEVTVTGPVDKATGFVINITDLKKYIQSEVLDALDHKNIDKDVPHFEKTVSTTENVAVFVWQQLSKVLPKELQLRVRLHETDKNVVTYEGLQGC